MQSERERHEIGFFYGIHTIFGSCVDHSAHSLVKTYQREVARQHKLMLKADHAHQQLLLVVQGLKRLFADENFVTLLRAEGLDSLPKYLADGIEIA